MKDTFKVGSLNGLVAVSDSTTEFPYVMYSQKAVQQRFKGVPESNPGNLVAVRLESGQLQYDSTEGWQPLELEADDRILAVGLREAGLVMDFEGEAAFVNGLRLGYCEGDLKFTEFNEDGMVIASGTYFEGLV